MCCYNDPFAGGDDGRIRCCEGDQCTDVVDDQLFCCDGNQSAGGGDGPIMFGKITTD